MLKPEEWREISNYNAYMISSLGNVKAKARLSNHFRGGKRCVPERIMKTNIDRGGYYSVVLLKNGKSGSAWVRRLVAIAFHGQPDVGKIVNHIDGNKLNNRSENLERCTPSENSKHNYKIGLQKASKPGLGKKGKLHHASIPVVQKCHGVVLAEYDSASCAARATGIPQGSISRVCRGERTQTCGFVFEYKKQIHEVTDEDADMNTTRFRTHYKNKLVKDGYRF